MFEKLTTPSQKMDALKKIFEAYTVSFVVITESKFPPSNFYIGYATNW